MRFQIRSSFPFFFFLILFSIFSFPDLISAQIQTHGLVVPQTAADLNGDGRTDLLEMNGYTSAYTYITATKGVNFTLGLVSDPVIGANGKLHDPAVCTQRSQYCDSRQRHDSRGSQLPGCCFPDWLRV